MRRIIFLLLIDAALSGGAAGAVYLTRGQDAALATGLSVLIAFSPICAILAEKLPPFFTRRKFAKLGIKLNNPDALKALAEVNIVALPFNRVLTDGNFFVTDLVPDGIAQTSLLTMAASAERDAKNILGRTVYDTATRRNLQLQRATEFRELPGRGVESRVEGTLIRVGNPAWLESLGVSTSIRLRTRIDQLLVKGKTVLLVSTGRAARGAIALKDELIFDAKKFFGALRRAKLQTLLLTALPKKLATRPAKELLIDHVRTNLTPEGKSREVQIFRAKGNNIAVIGNDFHDLPALVNADASIYLAGGSLVPSDEIKLDFEIPTLESFLPLRKIATEAVGVLKLNRRLALASWIILLPLALMTSLEKPPVPFSPISAAIGVIIFGAIILANSLRMK